MELKTINQKLRDRGEELGAKKKLVDDVQDELAVLHLQLDMVEKSRNKLEEENKGYVRRLMRYKGQEADALNKANADESRTRR